MTRITSFGRKRTYVEAGFHHDEETSAAGVSLVASQDTLGTGTEPEEFGRKDGGNAALPPKKKRKRTKKPKTYGNKAGSEEVQNQVGQGRKITDIEHDSHMTEGEQKVGETSPGNSQTKMKRKGKMKGNEKRLKGCQSIHDFINYLSFIVLGIEASVRAAQSEVRREKRTAEREANTTCFACRQNGHAAKNCPVVDSANPEKLNGRVIVGICYRYVS